MEFGLETKQESLYKKLTDAEVNLKMNALEALVLSSLLVRYRSEAEDLVRDTLSDYGVRPNLIHPTVMSVPEIAIKMQNKFTSLEAQINSKILGGDK